MEYSVVASKLRSICSELEFTISSSDFTFDSVWTGNASEAVSRSISELMQRTRNEISNINTFADALDSLQKFKDTKEKIALLKEQYYSLPNTEENSSKRIDLNSSINTLQVSNNQLRVNIKNVFAGFGYISSQLDVIAYDATTENYDQFIVDIDSLVARYANKSIDGTELDPLKILTGGSLYDYYNEYDENGNVIEGSGKAYVEGIILDIRSKYSGREAAVNSALAILQLAADKGIKIDYEHKGTRGTRPYVPTEQVASGVDCNPFVSWCVDKGVDTGFQWRPVGSFRKVGTEIKREDWCTAQPGDLLSSEGHIILIVDNDPEREVFTIAHAAGFGVGIVIQEKAYKHIGDYSVRDMTAVYNGEVNTDRWNSFSEYVDPNTFERNLV